MESIKTNSLTKKYANITAIDDVSFCVHENEIFGFLGSNGAGKSTTMMILTTLLKPTSGTASVCGYDVVSDAKNVRTKIGFVQQDTVVDEYLTGRENLYLQARLSHIPKSKINQRIDDILNLIELEERQNETVVTYSGGMRKRLDIAGGLLHRPSVLLLDEPTVGLDIQTRKKIWEHIRYINKEFGMSILLSTHYMEEADNLCNRVGIMDHGKIQIVDSPKNMKKTLGGEVIMLDVEDRTKIEGLIVQLNKYSIITKSYPIESSIKVLCTDASKCIPIIFEIASKLEIKINSVQLEQLKLDDVFMAYIDHNSKNELQHYDRRKEQRRKKNL